MDDRLPVVFIFLLIARFAWRDMSVRVAIPLFGAMVVLLAANVGSILWAWRPIGAQYDEFRAALPVIPLGARVIAFREDAGIDPSLRRGPFFIYAQLPALAVIDRDAYLPYLFKNPMMPVGAAPALRAIDSPHGHPIALPDLIEGADAAKGPTMLSKPDDFGRRNYWGDWPLHYDYAVELSFGARQALPAPLELLKSGHFFNIYRVKR